jgi:hypothetical protein
LSAGVGVLDTSVNGPDRPYRVESAAVDAEAAFDPVLATVAFMTRLGPVVNCSYLTFRTARSVQEHVKTPIAKHRINICGGQRNRSAAPNQSKA